MTKRFSLRKVAITLLSALFVLCASFGIVSAKNANSVKADEVVAFQMLDGADLRLDAENNGLRFAATVPSDYVEGDVYQMLIVPASWIKDVEIPNGDYIAYLEETYPKQELAIAPLHPITWAEESVAGFEEGKRYFLGAITDIKYENLNRDFFAIAYRTNGEVREYATFNEGQNVRSVFYIASAYAGVFEADTDSAKIVDNFIVSAINQKAGVAEADKLNAVSYDLSIAGSDTVKIGETASYAVAGTVGGVNISSLNAIVSYSVEGNGASISADGVLSVSEEGTVTVKAFVLGQELTKTVVVEKAIEEVTIDMGKYVLNTKDVEGINFVIEGIEGAPISVSYNRGSDFELDVAALSYDAVAQTLTIPYATVKGLYGPYATTFTITTDSAIYTVKVVFVTLAISDASQVNAGSTGALNQMQRVGGAETGADGSYYGYYILTNDIDFNGAEILHKEYALWAAAGGAHITLHGNGYAFKNFVVKSILFFDALGQDGKGVKSSIENVGFIGTVEGNYGLFGYYISVRLNNCYFDLKVAEGKNAFGSYYGPWMAEITNTTFVVSGINGGEVNFTEGDQNTQATGYVWTGSVMFIDNAQDSVLGGKLQGAKIYDYSDNLIALTVLVGNDAVIDVAGATKVLKDGKDITANVEITETGVVIPVAEISEGASYVVFAGDSSKVVTIDVVKESIVENDVVAYASKTDDAGNIVSNDFTYAVEGEVTSVKIDDKSVLYTFENGVVTIASDTLKANVGANKVITIATPAIDYVLNTTIATFAVSKFSDISNCGNGTGTLAPAYKALGATSASFNQAAATATGYIVLLNDIDAEGKVFNGGYYGYNSLGGSVNPTYGFSGTIDGNGYTISNFTTSVGNWGSVFGMSTTTRTIKDLTLIGKTGEGSYFEGMFGAYANSVNLNNVYFDIELNSAAEYGLFGNVLGGFNVVDSTFIIRTGSEPLSAPALANRFANANDGGSQNKANSFKNSVVITDYVVSADFINAGLAAYAYSDNVATVGFASGTDAVIEMAGVTRVLRGAKDITEKVVINPSNVVIPNAETSEIEVFVVIASTSAKIITLEIQRQDHNAVLGYSKRTVDATAAADFSYEVNGTVSYATIDGTEVEYTEDNGVVTIESIKALSSSSTVRNLVIATETDIYHIALTVADYVITSAEDYSSMNWQKALGRVTGAAYGSGLKAVVIADLDFGGATVSFGTAPNEWNGKHGFIGSLDFNGYAIHNLTFSGNLLGDNIGGSATISNLRLYDYTLTGSYLMSWYHNSVKYGWYIEGTNTKLNRDASDWGNGYRNWFRNGIILNTNEAEGVESMNMTSVAGGGGACGNLNVQTGYAAYTIQGYPNSYMIGNGVFYGADSWSQDETRCGTYKYSANVVTPAINNDNGSVTVDLGFAPTAVYKDGAKLDIALDSTIVIENADASVTYLAVGSGAVKVIRPTIVAEEVVIDNYVAYASKTNDNGEIISNDMVFAVESAVANVTIGAASVPFTTDGSNVVVASDVLESNTGAKVITIETYTKKYVINATIGTFGITKLADVCPGTHTLAAWRKAGGATSINFKEAASASSGYIVLTTDLVGTGTEMFHDGTYGCSQIGPAGNAAAYGFSGTFDGCGYSITNVVMGTSGAWVSGFGLTRNNAVIKNLTLQFTTQGAHFQGLFNQYATGTVENCTFDATANINTTVLGDYIAGLTMIDSTIIVRTGTGTLTDALASKGVHATNSQGSSVGLGASFVNTTLYTDYPVNADYANYGLVTKSIAEIPA